MPSDIALQISTGYDGNGLKQATQDVKGFEQQVSTTASNSGMKLDSLFKRIERPLGMIAFSGIANDLVDMGSKGESAGMMVEKGLHAAGNALMFFNPLLGIGVIAGTALYEALKKMGEAAHLTKEEMDKLFNSNKQTAAEFRAAAEEAQKTGERNDVIKSLQDQAKALDNLTAHTKDEAKAEMDAARNRLNAINTGKDAAAIQEKQVNGMVSIEEQSRRSAIAQKEYNDAVKAYAAVLADNSIKTTSDNDILKKREDIMHTLFLNTATLKDLQKELTDTTTNLDKIDSQIISTTEPKKLKALEDEREALIKLRDEIRNTDQIRNASATNAAKDYKKIGQAVEQMTQTTTAALVSGKESSKKVLAQMAADAIKITAEQATAQLQIQATKDLSNPATIGIGIAEMAAIGIINGLAGGLGAAITGGGGSTPSASGATGQNNVTTPSAGGNTQPQTQLMINVQGGVIDDNFAANLAKRLSDVVQFNGVQLVSSGNINYAN